MLFRSAIPKELDISLPQAYQKSAALRQLVSQSEINQQLFQVAQTIEGSVEKRTRVRARIVGRSMRDLFEKADNILIMGHTYPDLDSLGSCSCHLFPFLKEIIFFPHFNTK